MNKIDKFFDAGAVDYIKKPIDFQNWRDNVNAALILADCKTRTQVLSRLRTWGLFNDLNND